MSVFQFKQFSVQQGNSALKVGTDAMILGASVESDFSLKSILDIGAGTGVLSLMMAQIFPKSNVTAVELDELSSKDCQTNFEKSPWLNRFILIQDDFLSFEFNQQFDLIISNPPFYQSTLLSEDRREADAKHEQRLPSEQLIYKTSQLLSENGVAWFIFPFEDYEKWQMHFVSNELFVQQEITVFPKKDKSPNRMIVALGKKHSTETQKLSLTIRNTDGKYTDQYINLTKEFHFKDLRLSQ